jgi:hypothetical protein
MILLSLFSVAATAAATPSDLWGKNAEKWSPTSRLPDFSHAGYQRGERPLPTLPRAASVRDFGAKGDGSTDDSDAFAKALAGVSTGAIEVPPGRYRITKPIVLQKSGVVLRGAGPDQTILFFPLPLNDILPNWGATTTGERTSNYSWSGGFFTLQGSLGSKEIAVIGKPALRGTNVLAVVSTTDLRIGQEIEIYQSDLPDNSLAIALYSGDAGPVSKLNGKSHTSLVARITAIEDGRVTLDRPLRTDLELRWKPRIRAFAPTVTNSGVENLAFEFPVKPYAGHFTELGSNPLAFSGVANCWARNIRIRNADSGPFISGVFNTVDGVVIESERPPDKQHCTGHHGISFGGGDNLLVNFDIRTRFIHDITVEACTSGNVVSHSRGVDLSLDHHRRAPYENLFTDIDAGAGSRLWKCGGGADLGKHSGARETFWNIRAANPIAYPPADFGPPSMNLVAVQAKAADATRSDGKWFETLPPADIRPPNLYEAQKAVRLKER